DAAVVGDVVAEVGHRRGLEGGQPDGVDAEPRQVVEAPADALEIADAVPVRVLVGARIDLVHDAVSPPGALGAHRGAFVLPSARMRSKCGFATGITDSRDCRTSARSASFGSALIVASDTGSASGRTGSTSTASHLPLASFGSG